MEMTTSKALAEVESWPPELQMRFWSAVDRRTSASLLAFAHTYAHHLAETIRAYAAPDPSVLGPGAAGEWVGLRTAANLIDPEVE